MIVIPLLVVLSVLVIFQTADNPDSSGTVAQADPASASAGKASSVFAGSGQGWARSSSEVAATSSAAPAVGGSNAAVAASIASGALPAGSDFVATGAGTWHVVPGTSQPHGTGPRSSTYTVEVEDGIQTPEQDQQFAAIVDATLADPRSWIGGGQVTLTRIDSGDPDFRISLTSQMTIRLPENCGWDVPLEASCFNGWASRVLINDARWARGAVSYNGDLSAYRAYAMNHEVGHALGKKHEPCPLAGAPAPVMMQQSWSTSDDDLSLLDPQTIPHDGNVCAANPYPFPSATAVPSPSVAPSAVAG